PVRGELVAYLGALALGVVPVGDRRHAPSLGEATYERGRPRGDHDHGQEWRPEQRGRPARGQPRQARGEDDLVVPADRLRDDERRQQRGGEQNDERHQPRWERAQADQQRAGRLQEDRRRADQSDGCPDRAHRRIPTRQAVAATMIGTPGGVNGSRTSAIAPPARAAATARRSRTWGSRSAKKSAGNAASSPSRFGSPIAPPTSAPTVVPPTQAT